MNQPTDSRLVFLPMGFFLSGCGLMLALAHPPKSPEFVLSICSALLGAFLVVGTIIVRWLGRG